MLEGHKADWIIYDTKGNIIITLDCLYDSTDFLAESAEAWEIDYKNKLIKITKEKAE